MDEDQILRSIIADPQLTDPSIDVGQLRQTTPTRTELLADVPEFSGLKFDPTQRSYIEDLYSLYGGGAPMLPEPVVDTSVVDTTPIVDTSAMDQPAGDSILDTTPTVTTPTVTTPTVTQPTGGGADMATVPATTVTTPTDTSIAIEDLTQPSNVGDFTISGASPLENQTGTIGGAPVVSQQLQDQGPTTIEGPLSQVQVDGGLSAIDEEILPNYTPSFETPEQQDSFLQSVLGKAGQTVEGALNELGKVPGAIVDFTNQTVDIFNKKLNVGKTLASAAVNKLVGGPISLVFDALSAAGLEGGRGEFADALGDEYGMDDIGRLTSGPMAGYSPTAGNIVESAQERINKIENRDAPQTEASIKKIQDLNDFIQKANTIKTKLTAPQEDIGAVSEDITTGSDLVTGDLPGGGNIVDEFEPSDIQPTDPSLEIPDRGRGGGQDTGAVSTAGQAGPPSQRGGGADIPDRGRGSTPSRSVSTAGQAGPPSQRGGGDDGGGGGGGGGNGGGGGGGKIVCTMMNESYGFGSFRNKIWIKYAKDNLSPEHQIGYHKIFLPLVKLSKKNIILKKILEHIAVHRTIDIRQELRGKVHLLGRVYRKILEPICYWVGKYAKR